MSLMARGAAFLNHTLGVAAGGALTYSRTVNAVTTTASVTGWVGLEDRDEVTAPSPNTRNKDRERDYLIPVDQLTAFGTPQKGDLITETVNGVAKTFVVSKRDTEDEWRFSDHGETRYRIHTRPKPAQT